MIISTEVYGKAQQEKIISVVIEVNEDNRPFIPAYLKSRIYIDISSNFYEEGYEQLLRTLLKSQKEENLRSALLQNLFPRKNLRRCYQ